MHYQFENVGLMPDMHNVSDPASPSSGVEVELNALEYVGPFRVKLFALKYGFYSNRPNSNRRPYTNNIANNAPYPVYEHPSSYEESAAQRASSRPRRKSRSRGRSSRRKSRRRHPVEELLYSFDNGSQEAMSPPDYAHVNVPYSSRGRSQRPYSSEWEATGSRGKVYTHESSWGDVSELFQTMP